MVGDVVGLGWVGWLVVVGWLWLSMMLFSLEVKWFTFLG